MKRNMHIYASRRIFQNAKNLRRNMTPAEELLWEHLRERKMEGEKFRRQHPIKKFALDFYCYKLRFGIEVDGKKHSEPDQKFYDADRTEILDGYKVHIIRFTNDEVFQRLELVLNKIRHKILELRD